MTDIVERLRCMPAPLVLQNIDENYPLAMQLCGEAADEIERLREALKQAGLYAWQGDTFKIMDIARAALGKKAP